MALMARRVNKPATIKKKKKASHHYMYIVADLLRPYQTPRRVCVCRGSHCQTSSQSEIIVFTSEKDKSKQCCCFFSGWRHSVTLSTKLNLPLRKKWILMNATISPVRLYTQPNESVHPGEIFFFFWIKMRIVTKSALEAAVHFATPSI